MAAVSYAESFTLVKLLILAAVVDNRRMLAELQQELEELSDQLEGLRASELTPASAGRKQAEIRSSMQHPFKWARPGKIYGGSRSLER